MTKRSSFPERLRAARESLGLSTRAFDERAHLPVGRTWQIESGVASNVKVDTISRIAEALGCSIDWLVSGTGDGPAATEHAPKG